VPSKKASVAPSLVNFDVIRQVLIRPLKHMVTKPNIWMIVKITFMNALRSYEISKKTEKPSETIPLSLSQGY
jgi:hypothetical protein